MGYYELPTVTKRLLGPVAVDRLKVARWEGAGRWKLLKTVGRSPSPGERLTLLKQGVNERGFVFMFII
jgi:hypothetical protein